MNERTRKFALIGGILLFVCSFILFGTLTFLFFILKQPLNPSYQKNETHEFLLTQTSPFQEETSSGIVTLPTSLEHEEFVSYINRESGLSTIITHFGGSMYECSGSCFCGDEETDNRRSASVLQRGLLILFSAFSVTMATKIAEKTFREQCIEKFAPVCKAEDVVADVEVCDGTEDKKDVGDTEGREFLCHGHCIGPDARVEQYQNKVREEMGEDVWNEFLQFGYEQIGMCEALKLDQVVRLTDINKYPWYYREERPILIALNDFVRILNNFCESRSFLDTTQMSDKYQSYRKEMVQVYLKTVDEQPPENFKHLIGGAQGIRDQVMKDSGRAPYCIGGELTSDPDGAATMVVGAENVRCIDQGTGESFGPLKEPLKNL